MKYYRNILFSLCGTILALTSNLSFAVTTNLIDTYTYLRCFYREDPSNLKPSTNYVWALKPDSTSDKDYYHVEGYWWSGALILANMFYSKTPQETLLSVCESTLKKKNINSPVVMFAGADTNDSLNYMIWSIDPESQNGKINKIVAFGDSLSDMQNMFNGSQWHLPNNYNYYAGRFSNGKNWLDYLSEKLNIPVYNWAIGGAAAGDVYSGIIRGVTSQVKSWNTYMQYAPNYNPELTLFTVLIGANDLVNYYRPVPEIMEEVTKALTNLIQGGGVNILLLNLPDVSRAPAFDFKPDSERKKVKAQVIEYNLALKNLTEFLQHSYPGVNIQLMDTYSFFNDLLNNSVQYGITNTTQSCLKLDFDGTSNYLEKREPRAECTNADTYVFWDLMHPTSHSNKVLADDAFCFIQRSNLNRVLNLMDNTMCK